MKPFRVIVAGSRSIHDEKLVFGKLDFFLSEKIKNAQPIQIISGTAAGVDQLGEAYAKARGFECLRYPADWNRFGKCAGYIRNIQMADHADAAVVFWDGESPGSKHMIQVAQQKNLAVRIIYCNR